MLNKDKQTLLAIVDAIEKIKKYISPFERAEDFYMNTVNFDAVMMNFIVIGEMVERLTDQIKEIYKHINWKKIKEFRNLIAHDYFGIDAEEVYQISNTHLIELEQNINLILQEITD